MKKKMVISLCDYTGVMVAPWVEAGYEAMIVDPQHEYTRKENGVIKVSGTIDESMHLIRQAINDYDICMVFGFPPCTDVAVSGTRSFYEKLKSDALVWAKSAIVAEQCRMIGLFSGAPWFFENPVSMFSAIFGKASFYFDPYEFGGYLPEDDIHPLYPENIAPRDAYPKKTCLWAGGGFTLPDKKQVEIKKTHNGKSDQYNKLGGNSLRTKNIRSATPRGFAKAVFLKYHKKEEQK